MNDWNGMTVERMCLHSSNAWEKVRWVECRVSFHQRFKCEKIQYSKLSPSRFHDNDDDDDGDSADGFVLAIIDQAMLV